MVLRFSDSTKQLLSETVRCSRETGGVLVGTEHLLLTLAMQYEGFAETLRSHGITLEMIQAVIDEHFPSKRRRVGGFSPRARRVLRQAFEASLQSGDEHIEPWHVLVALLEEAEGPARDILSQLGFSPTEQLAEAATVRENERLIREFQAGLEVL